jgi:hypothetical protein
MKLVDAGVDMKRHFPKLTATLQNPAIEVAENERTRLHLPEVETARIDKEQRVVARKHHAVMVGDLLVHAEPGKDTECGCKVAPKLPFCF